MQNMCIYIDAVYFDTVKISIHTDTFVAVCMYSEYIYTCTCNHTVDIYIINSVDTWHGGAKVQCTKMTNFQRIQPALLWSQEKWLGILESKSVLTRLVHCIIGTSQQGPTMPTYKSLSWLNIPKFCAPKSAQDIPKTSRTYPQDIPNISSTYPQKKIVAGWFLLTSPLRWPSLTSAPLDSMVAFQLVVSLQSSRSSMNFPPGPRVSWMFFTWPPSCFMWKF